MNIPAFLFAELDKAVEDFEKNRGGDLSHQDLILTIFKHIAVQMGISETFNWLMSEGGHEVGVPDLKTGGDLEKKHHVKYEEEEWQPTRIEGKRYQTHREKKELVYSEVSNTEDDNEVHEVTDKAVEWLESVIEGWDLQPAMLDDTGKVTTEAPHAEENYDLPEGFPKFQKTHNGEDGPKNVRRM